MKKEVGKRQKTIVNLITAQHCDLITLTLLTTRRINFQNKNVVNSTTEKHNKKKIKITIRKRSITCKERYIE